MKSYDSDHVDIMEAGTPPAAANVEHNEPNVVTNVELDEPGTLPFSPTRSRSTSIVVESNTSEAQHCIRGRITARYDAASNEDLQEVVRLSRGRGGRRAAGGF